MLHTAPPVPPREPPQHGDERYAFRSCLNQTPAVRNRVMWQVSFCMWLPSELCESLQCLSSPSACFRRISICYGSVRADLRGGRHSGSGSEALESSRWQAWVYCGLVATQGVLLSFAQRLCRLIDSMAEKCGHLSPAGCVHLKVWNHRRSLTDQLASNGKAPAEAVFYVRRDGSPVGQVLYCSLLPRDLRGTLFIPFASGVQHGPVYRACLSVHLFCL